MTDTAKAEQTRICAHGQEQGEAGEKAAKHLETLAHEEERGEANSTRSSESIRRMMTMKRLLVLGLTTIALAGWGVPVSAGATPARRWFHSPSDNINCEVEAPGDVRCETFRPMESVEMTWRGTLIECHGLRCIANGPVNATTLAYGRSMRVGEFRCTSLRTGIRCLVETRSPHGFLISHSGIRAVGP